MTSDPAAALLETIPIPVVMIAPDETVTAINEPAQRLIGAHMMGRHYITALRQPNLIDKVQQVIRDGETASARFLGREAGRDTVHQVQIAATRSGTVLSFTDMTATEDIGQFRRDFVANVSHELRTPLTALTGFIDTLNGPAKDDPEAQKRFLSIMKREAGRMTRLVDDLLSLSRVEAEGRVRPSDEVSLSAVLIATIANLEPVLDQTGSQIEVDDQSGAALVLGDPNQLRQVVSNLIENAAKYGGKDGEIQISLTEPVYDTALRTESVRLIVKDNGPGIAEHHIARLTERFYRVDSHRSRQIGGTGLGLAIVKHIVNRHRGRLQIESTVGEGSVFFVILPVASA